MAITWDLKSILAVSIICCYWLCALRGVEPGPSRQQGVVNEPKRPASVPESTPSTPRVQGNSLDWQQGVVNESKRPAPLPESTQSTPRVQGNALVVFNKKPLLSIVDDLAAQKKVNVIVPQAAADLEALKQQLVTYTPRKKAARVSLDAAWDLLETFLELSGFSLVKKKDDLYAVVRNSSIEGGAVNRDILPLYADTRAEHLPPSDERIRYIYSFRILKVPGLAEKEAHPLTKMLKDLLSKDSPIIFEPISNSVVLTDKASHIASIVRLLNEFERRGFQGEVAFVPLSYIPAADVVKVFDALKKASGEGDMRGYNFVRTDPAADSLTYFTQDTTFVADTVRNAVILMGKQANVDRISEFIRDSMDTPPDEGGSILHYYDLQYLEAGTFAPILQSVVQSFVSDGQATQAPVRVGQEHIFKGVQIMPEIVVEQKQEFTTEKITLKEKGVNDIKGIEGAARLGGNRLIIAAWQDDWKFIKQLLKKLDVPQYQVILEMMIVDFTYNPTTTVAGDIRSRTDSMLPCGVQFLASHITPVSNVLGNTPTQLAQDLLAVVGPHSVASNIDKGSLLISFNDPQTPGIFALLQVLNKVLNAKIRSYPYLMVTNNQKGSIETTTIKRNNGDLVTTTNGTFTIPVVDIPASFKIVATPHIASEDRVRLDIGFTIDAFKSPTSLDRVTRGLKTTATLASGQILAMGGLIRNDTTGVISKTPILGSIPILGVFFRKTSIEDVQVNVSLFVCPTIVKPRSRHLLTQKTEAKIRERAIYTASAYDERDPISRLFFKENIGKTEKNFYEESSNLYAFKEEPFDKKPIKLLKKAKVIKKKDAPSVAPSFKSDELKELLAHLNGPLLSIKDAKGQLIFNC